MKARPPEAAGGRPGPAGRSGPASFSGPSSRTKAAGAAGAGLPVSGALGAALLAAAALLFAPGEARAAGECGSAITLPITCTGTSYPDGIFYGGSDDNNHPRGNGPINVAGSSTGPTTITATDTGMTTQQSVGIYVYGLGGSRVWNDLNVGVTVDSMGEMTDAGHVVDIVQGTSTNNAADRNNGIYFQHRSQMGDSTVRVGRGVTIGSETTPMQQNGIFYHPRGLSSWGGGKATLISAATIFAAKQGIRLFRNPSNVYHPTFRRTSHTTITNRGAIRSGEEGVYLYFARPAGGATHLGDATITNTGAITVSGARYGIFMDYRGYGATEIDNEGTIAAAAGSGIHLAHNNNGTVTLTNSGGVDVATVGLRIEKRSGTGAVAFTNSGRVTVTADAAAGAGHALWLTEGAGVTGGVTITNRGVLSSKNHALYAEMSAANAAVLTLTNEAAIASADGDGIRLARGGRGRRNGHEQRRRLGAVARRLRRQGGADRLRPDGGDDFGPHGRLRRGLERQRVGRYAQHGQRREPRSRDRRRLDGRKHRARDGGERPGPLPGGERRASALLRPGVGGREGCRGVRPLGRGGGHRGARPVLARRGGGGGQGRRPGRVRGQRGAASGRADRRHRQRQRLRQAAPGGAGERGFWRSRRRSSRPSTPAPRGPRWSRRRPACPT